MNNKKSGDKVDHNNAGACYTIKFKSYTIHMFLLCLPGDNRCDRVIVKIMSKPISWNLKLTAGISEPFHYYNKRPLFDWFKNILFIVIDAKIS